MYVRVHYLSKIDMSKLPPTSFWCRRNGPRHRWPQDINTFQREGKWETDLRTGPRHMQTERRQNLNDTENIPPYRLSLTSKLTLSSHMATLHEQTYQGYGSIHSVSTVYHLKFSLSTIIFIEAMIKDGEIKDFVKVISSCANAAPMAQAKLVHCP